MKTEAEESFETSIYLCQAARRHIRENTFFLYCKYLEYLGLLNFSKWEKHDVMCWCSKIGVLVTNLITWYSNKESSTFLRIFLCFV